jgi:hypothetical protein
VVEQDSSVLHVACSTLYPEFLGGVMGTIWNFVYGRKMRAKNPCIYRVVVAANGVWTVEV